MARLLQLAVALGGAIAFLLIRLFWRRRSLLRHLPVPVGTLFLRSLACSLIGTRPICLERRTTRLGLGLGPREAYL